MGASGPRRAGDTCFSPERLGGADSSVERPAEGVAQSDIQRALSTGRLLIRAPPAAPTNHLRPGQRSRPPARAPLDRSEAPPEMTSGAGSPFR